MFGWLRKLTGSEPKLGMKAHPVIFNPTPVEGMARNHARMERLKWAIAHSTDADEIQRLQAELARRENHGR